jgi:hypothetical protein
MNLYEMGLKPTQEQAQRNAEKVLKAINALGTKYLLHPANRIQRKH